MSTQQAPTQASGLSADFLRIIRGEVSQEEKATQYDQALQSWWQEYAARKNDEEEEHVADSLLYDERCHLPRTAPRPVFLSEQAAGTQPTPPAQPTQSAQATQLQANGTATGQGTGQADVAGHPAVNGAAQQDGSGQQVANGTVLQANGQGVNGTV